MRHVSVCLSVCLHGFVPCLLPTLSGGVCSCVTASSWEMTSPSMERSNEGAEEDGSGIEPPALIDLRRSCASRAYLIGKTTRCIHPSKDHE